MRCWQLKFNVCILRCTDTCVNEVNHTHMLIRLETLCLSMSRCESPPKHMLNCALLLDRCYTCRYLSDDTTVNIQQIIPISYAFLKSISQRRGWKTFSLMLLCWLDVKLLLMCCHTVFSTFMWLWKTCHSILRTGKLRHMALCCHWHPQIPSCLCLCFIIFVFPFYNLHQSKNLMSILIWK